MPLYNFLYLDSNTIDDYLSQIEGSVIDSLDQTKRKDESKGVQGDATLIKGGLEKTEGAEKRETRRVTPQAKFKRLYKYLERENELQYLDAFDDSIWSQIKRNEILEISANISIPKSMQVLQFMPDIQALLPLMNILNVEANPSSKNNMSQEQLSGVLGYLSKDASSKPISVVFDAMSTPDFKFVADLKQQFLKSDTLDANTEATILCKVLRIIPEGACIEISGLMDDLFKMQNLANAPKANIQKSKQGLVDSGFMDRIDGPAMKVFPIAIYR